jgi:hypothetical protein
LILGEDGLQQARANAKKCEIVVQEKSFEDLFTQFVSGELGV